MFSDSDLFAALDDLESQAEAMFDEERAAELADRSRTEYAEVTLASRMMASAGAQIRCEVAGVGQVRGTLTRSAGEWSLIRGHGQDWVIRHDAIVSLHGASMRSVPEVAWTPLARLGFASALRRLADAGERCVLRLRDGAAHDGTPARVGRDFVEMSNAGQLWLVATAYVAAVQSRDQVAEV